MLPCQFLRRRLIFYTYLGLRSERPSNATRARTDKKVCVLNNYYFILHYIVNFYKEGQRQYFLKTKKDVFYVHVF